MLITDASSGKKLTEYLDTGLFKKVLLPCWHGVGDIVMFNAPLTYLKNKYPDIQIDAGLARGLQQLHIIPDAVELDGDWAETVKLSDYDLVFSCHMPLEDANNTNITKAEVCCTQELGIPPVCGHLKIKRKKIVGLHFHNTSVASVTNPTEEVCKKVWEEVIQAGMVPVETLFQHGFYNDSSKRYDFTENHVRNWPARLDTCISLIGACDYFVGVVSGNFHIALSLLPYDRVCLLEKKLRVGHFTKLPVKGIDTENYKDGDIKRWLENMHSL